VTNAFVRVETIVSLLLFYISFYAYYRHILGIFRAFCDIGSKDNGLFGRRNGLKRSLCGDCYATVGQGVTQSKSIFCNLIK
jgi:hypothetical protein